MKIKLLLTALILATISLNQSCKKKGAEPVAYTKIYDNFSFIVDTTNGAGNLTLGVYEVETDIISELSAAGFTVNNLTSVKINEIKLEATTPGQTLDYFRRIEIQLRNLTSADVNFATKDLPENFENNFVVFSDEGVDLKEYFKETGLIFTVSAINELPIQPDRLNLRLSLKFDVQASL
ncbi:MAG: hypothetical protein WED33_07850 [Bacteroidia bacterium]